MHRNNMTIAENSWIQPCLIFVIWLGTICALVGLGVANQTKAQNERANAPHIKWMHSVEYAALCSQAYRVGWEKVLAYSKTHDGKFVVVLDIDETILLNVQYNIEHEKYDDATWLEWVKSMRSDIVPGAQHFLERAHTLPEVQLAFISNRWETERYWTEKLMRQLNLFKDGDFLMLRRSKQDTKEVRRRELEQDTGLPIAFQFGDQISDFYELKGKDEAENDRQSADINPRWGREFIIFPNPVYGSWERDYQ